jgi:hypothetical protein
MQSGDRHLARITHQPPDQSSHIARARQLFGKTPCTCTEPIEQRIRGDTAPCRACIEGGKTPCTCTNIAGDSSGAPPPHARRRPGLVPSIPGGDPAQRSRTSAPQQDPMHLYGTPPTARPPRHDPMPSGHQRPARITHQPPDHSSHIARVRQLFGKTPYTCTGPIWRRIRGDTAPCRTCIEGGKTPCTCTNIAGGSSAAPPPHARRRPGPLPSILRRRPSTSLSRVSPAARPHAPDGTPPTARPPRHDPAPGGNQHPTRVSRPRSLASPQDQAPQQNPMHLYSPADPVSPPPRRRCRPTPAHADRFAVDLPDMEPSGISPRHSHPSPIRGVSPLASGRGRFQQGRV